MKNDDVLSAVRWPAIVTRLHELSKRVTPADMTPQEVLAIAAVLESVDRRVNARTAPVLGHLVEQHRGGSFAIGHGCPMGSLGNEVVGVDEHQTAGVQLDRPPSGRIGNAVAADLDGMSGQLTEILHDHP
jgi:hypothetical protein